MGGSRTGTRPSPRWPGSRDYDACMSPLQRREYHLPKDEDDENVDDANNEKKRPTKGRLNLDLSKA
jgi:hypothetical protein